MSTPESRISRVGQNFLHQWRQIFSLPKKSESDFPTSLKEITKFAAVDDDGLTLRYKVTEPDPNAIIGAMGDLSLDKCTDGVARGNKPVPSELLIYYFEAKATMKGDAAFGFSNSAFKGECRPSDGANFCGFTAAGFITSGGRNRGWMEHIMKEGDTIGAGINFATKKFFYTVNGTEVGSIPQEFCGPYFPTICIVNSSNSNAESGAVIVANFVKKFLFDNKAYEVSQRDELNCRFPIQNDDFHAVILSYLRHFGYGETAKKFLAEVQPHVGAGDKKTLYELAARTELRQAIQNGNIDSAFSLLANKFPLIAKDDTANFLLHSLKYTQLIKDGKIEEAIKYGRVNFKKLTNPSLLADSIKDCAALLLYDDPSNSPVGNLLSDSGRNLVADALNAMILSTGSGTEKDMWRLSSLEMLLMQSRVVDAELIKNA